MTDAKDITLSPDPRPSDPASAPQATASARSADAAVRLILSSLEDDKAEDIVTIDIRGRSSVADTLVVASGRSQRHVGALADHIVQKLKEQGYSDIRVEGLPHCDWVLVDAGDVITHLFRPDVRSFYDIERIWASPPVAARA